LDNYQESLHDARSTKREILDGNSSVLWCLPILFISRKLRPRKGSDRNHSFIDINNM